MQLVPLSTDGRITVVVTSPLPVGPLRVALRLDTEHVVIETLDPSGARRVGRFTAADATAYRPVLARLAARRQVGTCPARIVHTGGTRALILHLGPPATCAPRYERRPDSRVAARVPLALARTARLRASLPTVCAARPQRSVPARPSTLPRVPAVSSVVRDQRVPLSLASTRSEPLPARPPGRFGQPDDAVPRLTRSQRRRVLWATLVVAAALLLASVLQPGASTDPDGAMACADGSPSCARPSAPTRT